MIPQGGAVLAAPQLHPDPRYALIESTGDAVFLMNGTTGALLEANPSFCDLLGYTQSELAALSLFHLVDSPPAELREHLARVIAQGSIHLPHRRYRRKDRTLLDVEITATAVHSADGPLIGVIARDVTGRKIAEREQHRLRDALASAAAEWRHTFDAIPSPVLVVDSTLSIARLNSAAAEYLRADIAALLHTPLPNNGLWRELRPRIAAALDAGTPEHLSVMDEGRYLQITVTPGNQGQAVVLFHSITDAQFLHSTLRNSEVLAALGILVAGVAHEVRNPIFTISALIETFELSFGFTPEQKPYIAHLRAELNRLNRLMHDLLAYGKAGNSERERTDLVPLIQGAANLATDLLRSRNVAVVFTPGPPAYARVDPKRLGDAVRNLIENAIHHSPEHGSVRLTLEDRGDHLRFSVYDSGKGFSDEALAHAFEPFYSRRPGGTGLGLPLAQRVVVEHGGKIWIENSPAGGGCVHFTVPVEAA